MARDIRIKLRSTKPHHAAAQHHLKWNGDHRFVCWYWFANKVLIYSLSNFIKYHHKNDAKNVKLAAVSWHCHVLFFKSGYLPEPCCITAPGNHNPYYLVLTDTKNTKTPCMFSLQSHFFVFYSQWTKIAWTLMRNFMWLKIFNHSFKIQAVIYGFRYIIPYSPCIYI